jgi:hypothetical protein
VAFRREPVQANLLPRLPHLNFCHLWQNFLSVATPITLATPGYSKQLEEKFLSTSADLSIVI